MPCKFPGNFFAIKPNGGLILSKGKSFSFKPLREYTETFDSFTNNKSLTDDGAFFASLDSLELESDSLVTVAGAGINDSMAAKATADSCNTFTCMNWNSARDTQVNFETTVKWGHNNFPPFTEGEIFFVNFRESLGPSSLISDVSQRAGLLISQRTDGDYQLYATHLWDTSLATISKSDIEYDTSDTNWIKIIISLTKTSTSNRWDLSVKLYNTGQYGTDSPTLLTETVSLGLYDSNIYNDNMYVQLFIFGFPSPLRDMGLNSTINNYFSIDNFKLSPLPNAQ